MAPLLRDGEHVVLNSFSTAGVAEGIKTNLQVHILYKTEEEGEGIL